MSDKEIKQLEELNEKWDIVSLLREVIQSAHTEPSPKTLEMLSSMEEKHNQSHKEIMDKLNNLEVQFEPVSKIYKSAQGFGAVAQWIAKYIISPVIVLIGAMLTFKNIIK